MLLSLLIKIISLCALLQYLKGICKRDSFKMLFFNKKQYKEKMDIIAQEMIIKTNKQLNEINIPHYTEPRIVFTIIFVIHLILLLLPLTVIYIPAFTSLVMFEFIRFSMDYIITIRIAKGKAKDYEYVIDHVLFTFSFITYPLYIIILILSLF